MAASPNVEIEPQMETLQNVLRLRRAIGAVIRGKDEAIRLSLVALFAGGHLLIEDAPGVGKTTLAHALARSLGCSFRRIQFTADMLPSDITGVSIFNPRSQKFEFRPGPLFAQIVLADEINRATPKAQSALLEAMNEAQVTVDGQTRALPQPFMVIATQNPMEHHGAFPLPESQLDRFLMRIEMGYPSTESEKEILRGAALADPLEQAAPVIEADEVLRIQRAARQVSVDEELLNYLLAIVERTRRHAHLSLGVSPRGSLSLCRAAQALALLEGRSYCIPDDFKSLALLVFAHRCVAKPQPGAAPYMRSTVEAILLEILDTVPVPL